MSIIAENLLGDFQPVTISQPSYLHGDEVVLAWFSRQPMGDFQLLEISSGDGDTATAMGNCTILPDQLLMQVYVDAWSQIRPRKGIRVWHSPTKPASSIPSLPNSTYPHTDLSCGLDLSPSVDLTNVGVYRKALTFPLARRLLALPHSVLLLLCSSMHL